MNNDLTTQQIEEHKRRCYELALAHSGIKKRFLEASSDRKLKDYFFFGRQGTGKTWEACGLLIKALKEGKRGYILRVSEFFNTIQASFNTNADWGTYVDRYRNAEVLIIDDLGKEAPTRWAFSQLFNIIDHRYDEMLSTIITSNRSLDEIIDGYVDSVGEANASAMGSRIAGMCEQIRLSGDDKRLI